MVVGHFVGELKEINTFNLPLNRALMSVLIKNEFTCSVCQFRSKPSKTVLTGYMLPLPVSKGHAVFCALCAGARMLSTTFEKNELGKLIYAPNMTQKNVSDAFRICTGITLMGPEQVTHSRVSRANRILDELKSAEMMVDANVNPFFANDKGSTLPLGELLSYCSNETKSKYGLLVSGVRFLPENKVYQPVISYYLNANPKYFRGDVS